MRTADVVIVGGGLGGVAAALAAAEAGRSVVLTCAEESLGGQITTQLVPALDEHPHVETGGVSASYRRLRDLIRAGYGGLANPGGGWVSRLCFEPQAGARAIEQLLAPHVAAGRLTVLTDAAPAAVRGHAGLIEAVTLSDGQEVEGEVFCDATELGDLLALAGAPWVCGSEGGDAHGESLAVEGGPRPEAVQSCTVGFLVEHLPGEDHTVARPPGYERWRDCQPFALDIAGWDGRTHRYRMFDEGPDGSPPFWTYRRLRDASVLGGRDLALINWVGNDYADRSLIHEPERAAAEARLLSLAFLHWLQAEAGFPGLRLVTEAPGTSHGMAAHPYVRESRRLAVPTPVTEHALRPVPGQARAAAMPDSVGVAWYHMDLHPRVGHPDVHYAPSAPFQIPLSALVAPRPGNLLAAAKNLGATQAAAAAYRVHHGEWAVGEASGTAAAHCVRRSIPPARLGEPAELAALQAALVARGAPIAWVLDVGPDDPLFAPVQRLAAAGAVRPDGLDIRPHDPLTDADRAALLAAADRLGRPGSGADLGDTWARAATALAGKEAA
ncbi:FAD-dependent oxidoreductase [Nonomuraea deserti]|uniref:FAD-dependent oxidoreductase n=1 Tax=Nonomuraea deserti TaxID=1848322 RepID=A0A4R4VWF2_9ACTN|nr:FAD-dependent oxidoreductase [Nonomuraea deserti]TDD07733.1 FAD-dependent oxidoreductase [Nonomuraea deserti]